MRKSKLFILVALLIGAICVSGCSGNTSTTSSPDNSITESSVVESSTEESSIEESSIVESSVEESSIVSEESREFTVEVATEKLKKAILSIYPDAVFGEVEVVIPVVETESFRKDGSSFTQKCCRLGIKGHATITDSYGYSVNKSFNYCSMIFENGYVSGSTHDIGKYYGGRESLPEECEGFY